MVTSCNYPPDEILQPVIGKPNYEYIILWILSNNETCSWSDLKEKVNRSTLSIYLNKLKREGYILKSQFNEYRITSKGRERYYELGQVKKGGRKLSYPPKVILDKRNYDHTILWMVYNNNYCKWADFLEDPLLINQSSLSKNMNLLIEKGFVIKENKEYTISRSGKLEYSKMLSLYDLDRQSILEEESKRIAELTQKTIKFFETFQIREKNIQFRFLNCVLRLDYERIKSVLKDEDDFRKILLFLSINHPNEYPKYVSPEEFSKKFRIKQTTLNYYIDEIVENQIYPIRFFKLKVLPDNYYYFQSDEKIEMMLRVITEEHITKFTYLNKLFEDSSDLILPLNMNSTVNAILEEACQNIFNEGLKNSLKIFLPGYIRYLAYKIEREKLLIGVSDKLEGIIWQNIPEMIQTNISQTKYQFISESEMSYYLDMSIFEALQPYIPLYFEPEELNSKIQNYIQSKDYDENLRLEELKKIFSDSDSKLRNLELNVVKGIILCHLNRYKESIELLNEKTDLSLINKDDEIYIPSLFVLAFSYMALGDLENALMMSNKAIEIYSKHSLSYALNGLVFGYNNIYTFNPKIADTEDGISKIEKAITLESNNSIKANYYHLKGHILLELNSYDDALSSIDTAIKLNPNFLEFYYSKIRILIYFDEFDKIIKLLDRLLEDFPDKEKNLKIKKAYVLKEKKEIEAGLDIINELIEKYPKDNNLLLNKIYWLQYLDEKEIVLITIEDLIEKNPDMGIYHDTYGEILMNFEEYEKAAIQFLKTIELASEEWYINQTYIKLGICYKELENFSEAIENLVKGQEFTNKCFCDLDTKKKWLAIVNLYMAEIEQIQSEF
ncbi:MAG: hypothetical protein ACFFA0_13920 [Promethearchaeota archaeon]